MRNINKLSFLFFLVVTAVFNSVAQKPDHPKHENHYKVDSIVTADLKVVIVSSHSQQQFTLVKLRITNKTNDFILFKTEEVLFKYAHGDYKPKTGVFSSKDLMIEPNSVEEKSIKVSGDNQFHVEKLKVEFTGFYKINAKGKEIETADFQLPASVNNFTNSCFSCSLGKVKQKTSETYAEFACHYNGKEVALVDPSKLAIKIKDGRLFANDKKKKAEMLMPNEGVNFLAEFHIPGKIADMQISVMDIVWRDTFIETKMAPVKVGTIDLVLDPALTQAGNN